MITKSIKKTATGGPIVRFFMSEDLRQEVSGKVSAIGLFSDNVMVMPLPDDIPAPSDEQPIVVKSLALLFNISRVHQQCQISVEIEKDGVRRPFLAPRDFPALEVGRSQNLIMMQEPCLITAFGVRQFIVTVGEHEQRFEYEFRRQSITPPALSSAPVQAAVVAPALKKRATTRRVKQSA